MRPKPKQWSRALLTALVFLVVAFPLLEQERGTALTILNAGFTLVLLVGLYAAAERRRTFVIGLCLFVPAILCGWLDALVGRTDVRMTALALEVAALAYLVWVVSGSLMRAREVTFDSIASAVNVYLVIGLVWAQLYQLLLTANPSCIVGLPEGAGASAAGVLYFSFVTLTTLGYGDILPVSAAARGFVTLEAVVGQIFLTVMIARLVGMYIATPSEDKAPDA